MKRNENEFTPQLISSLKSGYGISYLKSDMTAGLSVAVVSFPLAMALAIASGLSPDKGIITAIVAGFLISMLGGSKTLIGGPTSAFVIVVFDLVARHGYDGMIIATMLAGIILIIAGWLRLGDFIKWLPMPVISGFTTGIAIVIASAQVKDLFGLDIKELSSDFVIRWASYIKAMPSINIYAAIIGFSSILLIMISRAISHRFPIFFVIVIIGALLKKYFDVPVETIGEKFPEIAKGIDVFVIKIPAFSYEKFISVVPSAFVLAFLAGVESLISALIAGGMTGNINRPNQELVAQGFANFISPLFGGMPATGAFSRTAANIRAGAKSPMSGIFHSLFILIFSYFLMDVVAITPLAVVAGILVFISWGVSGLDQFKQILIMKTDETVVLLISFFLTVFVDIASAIAIGVIISFYIFIKNMSASFKIKEENFQTPLKNGQRSTLPKEVEVFQINGPIFFGVANRFLATLKAMSFMPKVVIIRMRFIPYVDISGEAAIKRFVDICHDHDIKIIFSAIQKQPKEILLKAGIKDDGKNIFFCKDYKESLRLASKIIEQVS